MNLWLTIGKGVKNGCKLLLNVHIVNKLYNLLVSKIYSNVFSLSVVAEKPSVSH